MLKPAEQTPVIDPVLVELIADLLPAGVSTSSTASASRPASRWRRQPRIAKIAFTGETTTGRLIMQYAAQNLIPVTLELGGKSPNIFFDDVMRADDDFRQGGGLRDVRAQPGRGLHLPEPRAHPESIYDKFIERRRRARGRRPGQPAGHRHDDRRAGQPTSSRRSCPTIETSARKGAQVLTGGERNDLGGDPGRRLLRPSRPSSRAQQDADLPGGDLRSGRPVTTFKTRTRRSQIANDTLYGLGAGVWTATAPSPTAGPRHPGRPRVDEHLPRLPGARGLRRLQQSGIGARTTWRC